MYLYIFLLPKQKKKLQSFPFQLRRKLINLGSPKQECEFIGFIYIFGNFRHSVLNVFEPCFYFENQRSQCFMCLFQLLAQPPVFTVLVL